MGLHKGAAFHTWLQGEIEESAKTTDSLLQHMRLGDNGITLFQRESDGQYRQLRNSEVELWTTGNPDMDRHHYPLRLVASEVSTQSMIIFPRDADLFYVSRHGIAGERGMVAALGAAW
jgi:predicted acylesterase/phospholipase RssA